MKSVLLTPKELILIVTNSYSDGNNEIRNVFTIVLKKPRFKNMIITQCLITHLM